jgi:transcription initiation factor TFIIIB Brf1 subunit/transcription initiation factor TFIIB
MTINRTYNEIAEANNVKRKEMWDAYRTMLLEI